MTNSDSGTKLNPGDRVRVRHDPKRDDSLQARHADRRAAFNGKIVRVETIERDGDVLVSEGTDDGAWFNPAELSPIVTDPDGHEVGGPAAPLDVLDAAVQQALAAARQEAQGWHSAALLARGEAEEARQEAKRLAGDLAYIRAERDVLRGKLGAAEADSATLHAALVAERKEVAGWRSRAFAAEAKIPRETEEVARLEAALRTRDVQLNESRTQRKAAETALAAERSIHETAAIGADKLARQIAAVRAAWGTLRAWMLALPRPLGAAGIEGVDAVDKALGGVAVAEQKAGPWQDGNLGLRWRPRGADPTRSAATVGSSGWTSFASPPAGGPEIGADGEKAADRALLAAGWTLENPTGGIGDALPCEAKPWTLTGDLEQRVAEIEARLGRLESGK